MEPTTTTSTVQGGILVIYNNGYLQHTNRVHSHYLHLFEINVVHHIINANNWTRWDGSEWQKITDTNF